MLFSSLLAVVYVWRVVETLYFSEPSPRAKAAQEAPWTMLVPTYVVIGATVVFGCWTVYSAGLASKAAHALLGIAESGGLP
jgi:multicomponent Na+:H+ antiporter subunit D